MACWSTVCPVLLLLQVAQDALFFCTRSQGNVLVLKPRKILFLCLCFPLVPPQLILLWFLSFLKSLPYRSLSDQVSWFIVPLLSSLSLYSYAGRVSLLFFALACLSCHMHPFWEVTGDGIVNSRRVLLAWQRNCLPPSQQSDLGHLMSSWAKSAVALRWALCRRNELTLTSFEDPTAFGAWKTTANKMCFCYLPPTELKQMIERIMPY